VGSTSLQTPQISWHGGPVLVSPSIHLIFYGAWDASPDNVNNGKQIIFDFANGLGTSHWAKILTKSSLFRAYTSGSSTVTGSYANVYSTDIGFNPTNSTRLSTGDIENIVVWYIQNRASNVYDPNAIYVVLTSSGVTQSDGSNSAFCSQYCGWHSYDTINGQIIKFAWVGNGQVLCPLNCAAQKTGPNGNAGADGMVSVLAHELAEATTDPQLNAWYDNRGSENGDKCAWTFGGAQFQVNGAYANVQFGGRSFLIQRMLATNSKCYVDGVSFQQ
jgi:hypothetical protein